jgi:ubiquinone/menaquinone biosynthesis C-methylase UbiE
VVLASPDGWVWALWKWQELILSVPRWQLTDASFALVDRDRVVAVAPLQWSGDRTRLSGSGFGLTSPAVEAGVSAGERQRYQSAIFDQVRALAAAGNAQRVDFALSPVSGLALAAPAGGTNPLVQFGLDDQSSQARVLDLRPDPGALLAQCSKDTRQQIKRARAAGVVAKRANWLDSLDDYYALHTETYERTGVPPHPREYFEGIATHLAPAGHSVLWGAYDADGRAIAFHNCARLGAGAMYHTGCSTAAALENGANYLVFWESVLDAKANGAQAYEIGEVFPGADGKKSGLTTFKSKFGGELRPSFRACQVFERPGAKAAARTAPAIESTIRDAYERSDLYNTARICQKIRVDSGSYIDRLLADKFSMVVEHDRGGLLVDLCCAAGGHLLEAAPDRGAPMLGIDFSHRYVVEAGKLAAEQGVTNVTFVQADARQLPLAAATAQQLYCFSSLYAIPRVHEVVSEVGRILAPGGTAILDFGNRRSLNAFVLRYYPEWPRIHPITLGEIRRAVDQAGLDVVRHRSFQLLPMWADRPSWLWPLLHPFWNRVLGRRVFGRMIDEWISSMPLLRAFAFRHLIVCRKPAGPSA